MRYVHNRRAAFTLIELLVVIAIIAILAVVVILVLNPAELLRQSRDANRLSDLTNLNNATLLYIVDQQGSPTFSLGSSSVTYLSIPDPTATTSAGTDCSGLGFAAGGSFHCPASSTYRNDNSTGWIPINFSAISAGSPLSVLPVDSTNQTSSDLYYSYSTDGLSSFRLISVPESQKYVSQTGESLGSFQAGNNLLLNGGVLILVPGNAQLGTSNFWAMKYDAVCTRNGIALTSPLDGNGYMDYSSGASNCTSVNGLAPSSLPGAAPIVDVTQVSAISYCTSIGEHLIKNIEWQTIVWNAEGQGFNWSGAAVGSGTIYSGHNDNAPAAVLVADPGDANGYAGETNVGGTQRRTLSLSNGSVVWDMAGNLWQWTNDSITGTNEPNSGAGGSSWQEFSGVTSWGTLSANLVVGSKSSWNSTQGIGELFSEGATDPTMYAFARGGYWHTGLPRAGIETLNLTFGTSGFATSTIGFRCAR